MDSSFLEALAQARPDPGGGAAAAHSAALGLALLTKVVQLEHRRRGPEKNPEIPWGDLLARVRVVAAALLRLQAEDVRAYFKLTQARTSGDPAEMAAALEEAVACPLRIMQQAQEGLALAAQVRGRMRPAPGRGFAGGLRVAGGRLAGGAPHRPGQPVLHAPGLPAGRLGRGFVPHPGGA